MEQPDGMAGVTHDSWIGLCQFQQCLSEHVLVAWGQVAGVRFDAFACFFVKLPRSMPHVGSFFRRLESFSFHGVDVEQFRPFHPFQCFQRVYQFDDVMSVAGAEIANIHAFEHVLLVADERFQRIVETDEALAAFLVEPSPTEQFLRGGKPQVVVKVTGVELVEIVGHSAHAPVYAHVVVVQDDEDVVRRGGYIV